MNHYDVLGDYEYAGEKTTRRSDPMTEQFNSLFAQMMKGMS